MHKYNNIILIAISHHHGTVASLGRPPLPWTSIMIIYALQQSASCVHTLTSCSHTTILYTLCPLFLYRVYIFSSILLLLLHRRRRHDRGAFRRPCAGVCYIRVLLSTLNITRYNAHTRASTHIIYMYILTHTHIHAQWVRPVEYVRIKQGM